jgi:D-glycero-D-manno-heptose 1,7-bisphosphate phosphatase
MPVNIKNIVLDRDGTIIRDKHYLHDPDEVELLPGSAEALADLNKKGIKLFVATNQSGIGRGYFREQDYRAVQKELDSQLAQRGTRISGSVYCPHAPDEDCACRKPKTGMWTELKQKFSLHEAETAVIGDKKSDILFGRNSGLALCILVLTGHGAEEIRKAGITPPENGISPVRFGSREDPDFVASNLAAACSLF